MADWGVHPLSTALFVLGYALAIPITSKLPAVVARQHRLALWGHQAGILVAALGWLLRGRVLVFVAHLLWMVGASAWFGISGRRRARPARS